MQTTTRIRQALGRARALPMGLTRRGRWPLALGALLLMTSAASVLATGNTPPKITNATFSSPMIEGQEAVLTVTFTDPDPGDFHTLRLKWRDTFAEYPSIQEVQLPPGQTSVQVPHTFRRPFFDSSVQVAVLDRQLPPGSPNDNTEGVGRDVVHVPVVVNNVAPKFVEGSVTVQKEGRRVTVVGELVDPGIDDEILIEASWGLGPGSAPSGCNVTNVAGTRRFGCHHTYSGSWGVPRTYHIGLRAIDGGGGIATHQTSVRIP